MPKIVRVFDIPDRRFDWRRIRGQAVQSPYGIITFGQHARYGEPNAYFPHTIQSPPLKGFYINGLHIAEIGSSVLSFSNTPYLANIGCQASMKEATELSDKIVTIAVKDKSKNWEPSPMETYPIIYSGVIQALGQANQAEIVEMELPYEFSLELCEEFYFDKNFDITWKGSFRDTTASWVAPSIEIGLELFHYVRARIVKNN